MGGDWITTLPDGWRLKQIRHIFRIHNGATPKSGDSEYWNGDINWITPEDLGNNDGKDIVESRRKITSEGYANSGVSLAPAGSIAISTRAPIGHLAKTLIPSCVNQGCRLLEPKEGSSDYWYYASLAAKPILISRGQGTTFMELPRQSLASVKFPVPPDEEQKTIARFLDFKTAQIDALIAKQKTLRDTLAERRTALISHAVTKGLDPSVAMEDSGVIWLGNIPAHWKALPLRRLITTVKTGTTPSGVNEFHFDDDGVEWFRPGDFSDQIFLESAEKRLSEEGVAEVRIFPAFTVMHVGIGATIGKVGVTTEQSSCNQQINAIVCNERLHHLFAAYFLQAIKEYIVKCGKYTTLPIINQDETKSLFFTTPPIDEQIKISEYLLREEQLMDKQAKKISQVIVTLQEYRSALITNAVTGKIDVRGFAVPQPAEGAAS